MGFIITFAILYHGEIKKIKSDKTTYVLEDGVFKKMIHENYKEGYHRFENSTVAQKIKNDTRILCVVNANIGTFVKMEYLNDTWGKRCDKMLFMGSRNSKFTNS